MEDEWARHITQQCGDDRIRGNMLLVDKFFHSENYMELNEARLEHLDSLNLPIEKGMTVLEVGAGMGDLAKHFIEKGCDVVTTDGRAEHVELIKKNVGDKAKIAKLNLEDPRPNPLYDKKFDIVFCYGVLYHTGDPRFVLDYLAERCKGLFLLETYVSAGDELAANVTEEVPSIFPQNLSGMGCKPTIPWLRRELSSLFENVYIPKTQPCHGQFPYDLDDLSDDYPSRAVMIGSRFPIEKEIR